MRIIAAIYLTIMLVNFGIWLSNGAGGDIFQTPVSFVIWGLYFFSVLALLAFVLGKRILPRRAWQGVFIVYVAYRLLELATAGVVLNGDNPVISLNTISSYLWLVVPSALAMWYLGFMPFASRSRHRQEHSLDSLASHTRVNP
jgi:hypothetical protein